GRPVRGARVRLTRAFAEEPALTNDDGFFALDVRSGGQAVITVEPATYILINNCNSFEPDQTCTVLAGQEVLLNPDGPTLGHVVHVALPELPLWFGGWVTDAEGRPANGARVKIAVEGKGQTS